MTEQRASASGEGTPIELARNYQEPATQKKLTRDQMQSEALVIKTLLNAAMAMRNAPDPDDETILLVEMAHQRTVKLNAALDAVNA